MYLKIVNGVLQSYSLQQLRQDNPNTSFPVIIPDEMLADYSVYRVSRPATPDFDSLAWRVLDGDFSQDEAGQWVLDYKLEKLSLEHSSQNVRDLRNQKLSESDWTQVLDAPVDQAAWAIYRQALRNVTSQAGFPWSVVWPESPTP